MLKYCKQALHAMLGLFLKILPALLGTGVLIWLAIGENRPPILLILGVMLAVWLLLILLLTVMIASTLKKEQPLEDILAEQGYCEEWLQKHSEIYPSPDRAQKLRRADVLSYLGRYDEAKTLLESVPTAGMSDDRMFEYNTAWLDMLLTTGHYDEAKQKLDSCRKFMDIYSNDHPLMGVPYGCNACVILALSDDFEGSEHYYNAAEHDVQRKQSMSPAMVHIAKTMQLYALGFAEQAEAMEQQTAQEIINDARLPKQWQKDHFLAMLGKAKQLAPENRQGGAAV